MPKERPQQKTQVMGTNDSSSISKCSSIQHGYWDDEFLQHFVCKKTNRRSPLMHRGYYIRAQAMAATFKCFLNGCSGKRQIISLGAGFDSTYWKLKSLGLLSNCTYFEVDLPDVVKRKADLIRASDVLLARVDSHIATDHSQIGWNGENYKLLAGDLTNVSELNAMLSLCRVDVTCPTLIISEVVMTYLPITSSTAVLHWAANTFDHASFALYEQIHPDDGFGVVMMDHFKEIGSPLVTVQHLPTIHSQKSRLLNVGWSKVHGCDMNDFYARCVPDDEKQRMCGLEPFDEFEEWHLKCTHYVLLIGTKGICNSLFDSIFSNSLLNASEVSECSVVALNKQNLTNGRCNNSDEALQRFGHAMCQVPNDYLSHAADQAAATDGAIEPHHFVLTGGFGVSGGKHQRVNTVTVFNTATNLTIPVLLTSPAVEDSSSSSSSQELNLARMHHTSTFIDGSGVLLLGGRLSPCKPLLTPCLLTVHYSDSAQTNQLAAGDPSGCQDDTRLCYTATARLLDTTGVIPTTRWRHAAVSCRIDGVNQVIIHGGLSSLNTVLSDCNALDTARWHWTEVKVTEDMLPALHSHTMDVWQQNKLVIAGGLSGDELPNSSLYIVDLSSRHCHSHHLTIRPRYSHTSVIVNDQLILVGGVTLSHPPPGLVIIDLLTMQPLVEQNLPLADPEWPIMLHNHCSQLLPSGEVIIVGGGGNCFSFGTHFNARPISLTLPQSSQQTFFNVCDQ